MNGQKIILDLCGGTGSWSRPYKEAGYDVRLVTLPDFNVADVVFNDDYIVFNKQNYSVNDMGIKYADVYGILAAPPCTEFSSAKNGRGARDIEGAIRIVEACEKIIRHCQLKGRLKFWALENPKASSSPYPLAKFMGHPRLCFEQWQYGGKAKKATNIWGFFNNPIPTVRVPPTQFETMGSKHSDNMRYREPKTPDWCRESIQAINGRVERRAALRSITPPGFAQAFFKSNP